MRTLAYSQSHMCMCAFHVFVSFKVVGLRAFFEVDSNKEVHTFGFLAGNFFIFGWEPFHFDKEAQGRGEGSS